MRFVAIDFETANSKWDSVCALGMVMVDDGQIVDEYYSLINPEDEFDPSNIGIHGIRPEDVVDQPTFGSISNKLRPWLAQNLVIAHNASFDISVLKKVSGKYSMPVPPLMYACTCQLSRLTWPQLENHKLSTVARFLSLELDHHNAISDARACAGILLQVMDKHATADMLGLNKKTGYRVQYG